ncbi:hypothetical protein AALA17_04180 [Lactobacillaceae bacterium 24-114]
MSKKQDKKIKKVKKAIEKIMGKKLKGYVLVGDTEEHTSFAIATGESNSLIDAVTTQMMSSEEFYMIFKKAFLSKIVKDIYGQPKENSDDE